VYWSSVCLRVLWVHGGRCRGVVTDACGTSCNTQPTQNWKHNLGREPVAQSALKPCALPPRLAAGRTRSMVRILVRRCFEMGLGRRRRTGWSRGAPNRRMWARGRQKEWAVGVGPKTKPQNHTRLMTPRGLLRRVALVSEAGVFRAFL